MWHDLSDSGITYAEKTLRTVAVYVLILVLLRLAGKRELAQVNSFDLVVMLLLSNVVQNAIIGPDNSFTGAAYGAAVLVATNAVFVRLAARYDRLGRLFEGRPTTLARDGRWLPAATGWRGMRREDLEVAIRRQGGDGVGDTAQVTLEPGGTLVVSLNEEDQSADKADVAALQAAIGDLRREIDGLRHGR
ncbi:DUF421 domain-containing protein [Streptomyces sulfonofaciens]|uniref:DUF421 domain-containing protein n=1 Tax=Streptomyces sulfonofaciens TaxID=68272 RepID=A0A919GQU2_9ACTN|nr:DUF421 domain-containing protein [Streptomyces sulfonofaciens]GHH88366.1 DUF421 domain-containing protein [Streptomyces sulfonofaciens]